jgi:hypothetical protein
MSSLSGDKQSGEYALNYKSFYDPNFVIIIFIKREVSVLLNVECNIGKGPFSILEAPFYQ